MDVTERAESRQIFLILKCDVDIQYLYMYISYIVDTHIQYMYIYSDYIVAMHAA